MKINKQYKISDKDICPSIFTLSETERDDLNLFYDFDISACNESIAKEARRRRFVMVKRASRYAAVFLVGIVISVIVFKYFPGNDGSNVAYKGPAAVIGDVSKAYLEQSSGGSFILGDNTIKVLGNTNGQTLINRGIYSGNINNSSLASEIRRDFPAWGAAVIHKLFTPNGSDFKLRLPDKTLVHMNACSQLWFPDKFNKISRGVYLSGEAYFYVAKSEVPFIIKTDFAKVEVMGTDFNLSSYPEDGEMVISLDQGMVMIEVGKNKFQMTPGQQMRIDADGRVTTGWPENNIAGAWRNKEFSFENEPLRAVARKLSRWYKYSFDMEEGDSSLHVTAASPAFKDVNQTLQALRLEKKIYVGDMQ